jgi:hypothetical protein
MDIRLKGTALPAIAMQNIMAGRAVVMDHWVPGTRPNVDIGARYPVAGSAQTETRVYVAEWAQTNQKPPIYETLPSYTYSLRQGWDQGTNLPAAGITIRMVAPTMQEEQIIPSGTAMLMYDQGIYAVPSGCYNGTTFVPGQGIEVEANTGKWQALAAGTRVATCVDFEAVGKLVIKTGLS